MLKSSPRPLFPAGVLVLAAIGASIPSCGSSTTVTGMVADSATGQPLYPSRVAVASTGSSVLGDSAGRFVLHGVPSGQQVLVAQSIGYFPAEVGIIAAGDSMDVGTIRLRRNASLDSIGLYTPRPPP